MSKQHSIIAHSRKRSGSAALKQMRREGLVPAIVYGAKEENINLRVDGKTVTDLLRQSASEQILVNLEIEDQSTSKLALVQDVQHDALSGKILHIDFHAVREDEKISASIPIGLVVGDSIGVKMGGLIDQQVYSLEISCFPKDLPEGVEGDMTDIDVGQALHIKDVKFPEGVVPTLDGEVVVALCVKMRAAVSEDSKGPEEEEGKTEEKAEDE